MNLIPRGSSFFFDDVFNDFLTSKESSCFRCDIYEKDNKYFIEMDAPGISKEDTTIECDNGYLTIRISKKINGDDETRNYIRKERTIREYQRSFYVGEVLYDDIKASFRNGTLTIEIPKQEKIETKKTIEIQED